MAVEEKREVPSMLRKLLAVDAYLTHAFVSWAEQFLFARVLNLNCKLFEVTCNGVAWLAFNLVLIWVFDTPHLHPMNINLIIGLMLDIILVATLKAITRRRRPRQPGNYNSTAKDAFPSGYVSRATFITYYFIIIWPLPLPFIFVPGLLLYLSFLCMSRLLTRKHHVLDVLTGIVLGIFQGLLIGYIFLGEDTCRFLVRWITDEKISGAEYDV